MSATVLAVAWPWPAPDVDWRTPADSAVAKGDCATALSTTLVAAKAGSREAIERLKAIRAGGPCHTPDAGATISDALTFIEFQTNTDGSVEAVYQLERTPEDFWLRNRTRLTLFFCAMPYNGALQTDSAAISSALNIGEGPLMAFHRARRNICLRTLRNLAADLVDSNDDAAKDTAYGLVLRPPLARTTGGRIVAARLLLEVGFVPALYRGGDAARSASALGLVRGAALIELEQAAQDDDIEAIELLIKCTHQGHFVDRDDRKSYFWVLRLMRLGGNSTFRPQESLSSDVVAETTAEEDRQWGSRSRSSTVARSN